jgi:hypothetical protein
VVAFWNQVFFFSYFFFLVFSRLFWRAFLYHFFASMMRYLTWLCV